MMAEEEILRAVGTRVKLSLTVTICRASSLGHLAERRTCDRGCVDHPPTSGGSEPEMSSVCTSHQPIMRYGSVFCSPHQLSKCHRDARTNEAIARYDHRLIAYYHYASSPPSTNNRIRPYRVEGGSPPLKFLLSGGQT
jgi:hypothetical protein